MSSHKERLYIAAVALSVLTSAFLGVMLWEESRDPATLISVSEDGLTVSTDGRR